MRHDHDRGWWRRKFKLARDGDFYERLWWPLISNEFHEYELLWCSHIVATTNRVDYTAPPSDSRWFAFRDDPGIDNDLEQAVMRQYPIFYYLCRATLVIKYEPHLPEDSFIFLQITAENFRELVSRWRSLASELHLKAELHRPDYYRNLPALQPVERYRNAYVHSARIGRGIGVPEGFVPKWVADPFDRRRAHWEQSWRRVQKLPPEEFEDARELAEQFRVALVSELNDAYRKIRELLDNASARGKNEPYRKCFALNEHYNVNTPANII
jgi:hypothetical protein